MTPDYWNPEKFGSFECYFDYRTPDTVSFHFQGEYVVFRFTDHLEMLESNCIAGSKVHQAKIYFESQML